MSVPTVRRPQIAWGYPVGLLLLAGVAAYANSFQGDFVFDDRPAILESLQVRSLWSPWRLIGSTRPFVELTFAINYAVGRLEPWGYHLVNLLIHLAAALALYGLCRRTLTTVPLRPRYEGAAASLAFTIALLWLLHPLQTESVTYMAQRAESLMGLWMLLMLYAVCRADSSGRPRWTWLAVMACALGMLSKPVMVMAPPLALAYDRTFLSGSVREALRRRRGLYLGLTGTWLLLAAMLARLPHNWEATVGFKLHDVTPWEYAATQPGVICHYLRLALWPHPLILDYDWPIARTWSAILPPALGIVALLLLTLNAFVRRWPAGFLGLWIALTLAPTSSLFPIADLAVEHRMYLPLAGLIGLSVMAGWTLLQWMIRTRARRGILAVALVLGLAAVYATLTIRRNNDYRSELRMWADTVTKQPGNTRARLSLGYTLAQRRRYDEAVAQFNEILRRKPGDVEALNNLGLTMKELGRLEEAVRYFQEALRGVPEDALLYNNLGLVALQQQRRDEAIAYFSQAVQTQPRYMMARSNLGTQLLIAGRYPEALAQYEEAIALNPYFPEARHGLGAVLLYLGRYEEAAAQCEQALRLAPDNAQVLANLGTARYHQGRFSDAVRHLSRALALDPASKAASTNLQVVLSEHPELRQAP